MKKLSLYLVACFSATLMFTSCEKTEESFDETLLIGEWKGTEVIGGANHEVHYKYFSNNNGYSWDVTDDILESEAQDFTWTLEKSDLTLIHLISGGGQELPKYYTVTALTSTTLKYEDRLEDPVVKYTYTKVN